MWERLRAVFSGWSTRDKVHALLLLLVAGAVIGHQAALWRWFVEDSAISFAYARNLVDGEGLVAYPGGERVEGYSNPTWVLVLAAIQLIGLDPFVWVKPLQLVIAVATVPPVYLAVRETTGRDSDVPIVAVVFLAANSQFAIWGGAGLENGLLNLLIALGFLRMMVELRPSPRPLFPWSSAIWLLVALTRPEGILYAAVAGFCSLVFQLTSGRSIPSALGSTVAWLAVFFVPFGLYHAVHYWYFAWPLPNTYYAKLEDREGVRWLWERVPGGKAPQAWNWTRNFFHEMGQGYFLPIWILGVVGDGRIRYALATAAFLLVGGMIELSSDQRWLLPVVVGALWAAFWIGLRTTEPRPPRALVAGATLTALALVGTAELLRSWHLQPNVLPTPMFLKIVPPYVLASLAIVLALVSYRSRGWQLRVLSWLFCCAVIVFAIYVQWDWMKGFRWYATAAVPGAILFAFGTDSLVRFVEEMFGLGRGAGWRWSIPGTVLAAGIVLLQLPANIRETDKIATSPDAAPRSIKTRVDYVAKIRDRLHIEERLVDLDVDQGAHLWWSDYEMMDIAGLIDLPRAHQGFEKSFIREYIFEERKPHYAHVHGGWATNSKIPTHAEWRQDYLEVPGYPAGKTQIHPGNFVRRDLILYPEWPHSGDPVAIENGITLYGPHIESEPGVHRKLYIEVGISLVPPAPITDSKEPRPSIRERNFRTILFASDGSRLVSWDLAPGYDWLKPEKWKEGDIFVGKFDLTLPETLTEGTYDLGFVFMGADGTVIPAVTVDDGTVRPPPRMATGEVLYPGALTILSLEDRSNAAIADRMAAVAAAERLDCEEAERSWILAKHHRAGEAEWVEEFLPQIRAAFATCWAKSADDQPRDEQVHRLVRAREWDWWNDEYRARAPALSQQLYDEGLKAREVRDWETAYRRFTDAVDVDRSRAWARRYAEEARAFRLGIDPETLAEKAAEVAAKKAAAEEARDRRAELEAATPVGPEDAEDAVAPPEGLSRPASVALIASAAIAIAAVPPALRHWSDGVIAVNTPLVLTGPAGELPVVVFPRAVTEKVVGPTLLFYFSPSCPHCRHVAREVEALSRRLTETGTGRVLGVASGSSGEAELVEFRATFDIRFDILYDHDREILAAMGARSTPSAMLVAPTKVKGKLEVRDVWFPYLPGFDGLVEGRIAGDPWKMFRPGEYLGNNACAVCHVQEHSSWLLTHHSVAWRTLTLQGKAANPSCTSCHVTGAGRSTGWDGSEDSALVDVGCEACHGPGGPHDGTRDDADTTCAGCHDADHAIAFSVDKGLPLIDHYRANTLNPADLETARRALYTGEAPRELLAFPTGRNVGSDKCLGCHAVEHTWWSGDPHANGMATLRAKGSDDPACVRCHATAKASGPPPTTLDGFDTFGGVGCESCHGPGEAHVAAGGGTGNIQGLGESCPVCVIDAVCTSCHTSKWSPDWRLETALEKVAHRPR